MMNLTEQVKEFVWQKYGKVKNFWKREGFTKRSEEFLWKNDEFVWKSERIYIAQRYSKYRFFDVNCILSILFQVQLWGCPGKPKFQFHILSGRGTFIYIYIYDLMGIYVDHMGIYVDIVYATQKIGYDATVWSSQQISLWIPLE